MQISRLLGWSKIVGFRTLNLNRNLCINLMYHCNMGATSYECNNYVSEFMRSIMAACPELEIQLISDVKTQITDVDTNLSLTSEKLNEVHSLVLMEAEKTSKIQDQMITVNQNIEEFSQIIERVYRLLVIAHEEVNESRISKT